MEAVGPGGMPGVVGESRYALHEVVGQGGMGEVWAATDLALRRAVAVKVMHAHLLPDDTARVRFLREARAAASLNHPCIAAVYDTGVLPYPVHRPYIAMEYVQGRTIAEQLLAAPPTTEEAVRWTAGILEALDYAHAAGLVHRDIKPANVMITVSGEVKVMDFGIAFAADRGDAGLTASGIVLGTAAYMSPEQAQGRAVDARSDLYAVGCVLYELLTGRPPHLAESPIGIAYRHVHMSPVPPVVLNPVLPPHLDSVVLRALAKKPDDRFPTAAAMYQALSEPCASVQVGTPSRQDTEPWDLDFVDTALAYPPPGTRVEPDSALTESDPVPSKATHRHTRIALALTGLLIAGGLAAAAILYTTRATPPRTTTHASSSADAPTSQTATNTATTSGQANPATASAGMSATDSAEAASAPARTTSADTAATSAASDSSATASTPTGSTSAPTSVASASSAPSTPSSPVPSVTISVPTPPPK